MGELGIQQKNEKQWLFLIILLAFFLRIIKVGSLPALYTDEASFGYNAYSILKTGRDEYSQPFPLILRSFGDYKPALSSYLAIPFIALLGLNELAVRLPSVILGTLTVLFVYLLTKEIFEKQTASNYLSLIAAFLLAINPWHIHLTRMTMLVGIELFFITGGIYFFIVTASRRIPQAQLREEPQLRRRWSRKAGARSLSANAEPFPDVTSGKPPSLRAGEDFIKGDQSGVKYLLLSALFFSLAFYSYYGARLTVPLILLTLFILYRKRLSKKGIFLGGIFGFLLLLPLLLVFGQNPEILTARVKWISLFRYPEVRSKIWQASTLDEGFNPLFIRFFHNKPLFYGKDILRRALRHLSPDFLLFQGDKAAPFNIWGMGVSYLLLYPFLIWGVFYFFKSFKREWLIILYWLLISLLPASLTAYTPAANRAFGMVVPLQIFIALGLVDFFKNLKRRKYHRRVTIFLSVLFLLNFFYFLVQYFYQTPRKIPEGYHYGQKELVNFVVEQEKSYSQIIASSKATSYIYFLFYKKYPPESYWQESKVNPMPDDFGFEHIEGFSKYLFRRDFDLESEERRGGILYTGYPWEIGEEKPARYKRIKEILFPNGEVGIKAVEFSNPAI